MSRIRIRLVVGLGLLATVASATLFVLVRPPTSEAKLQAPADERFVLQGFPARTADPADPFKSETAWLLQWDITNPGNGPGRSVPPSSVLRILSATFMYRDRNGQPRLITVARDLRLGEVFVPYDRGSPRFQDVSAHPFWITRADESFLGPNCLAPGKVLNSPDPNHDRKVYKEVHDDGPRWVSNGSRTGADVARRGEKLLLWAVFYGANYRYLMEYGFHDDGSIVCRLGATAENFFDRRADQGDSHLHVACWRFDPDLGDPTNAGPGGPDYNLIRLARRVPQTPATSNGKYRTVVEPFAATDDEQAREGSALWTPEEFTTLRIESTVRKNNNDQPQPTGYDLVPVRHGSVRHFPPSLDFVNKDFWVTLSDPSQTTYNEVATYAAQQRPIDRKPVTIWHNAATLHTARAEDFGPDGRSSDDGIALTTWSSFMLRPRNLFDSTPLYRP